MTNTEVNLNLNIINDESNENDYIFCWSQFKKRPSKIKLHNTYNTSLFKKISSKYKEENIFTEIIPSEDNDIINDKILLKINDEIYLSYIVIDRDMEDSIISEIVFLYKSNSNLEEITSFIKSLENCIVDYEDESVVNNLNTLTINLQSSLDIEPLHFKTSLKDIEMYYPSKFIKDVDKVIKKIKKTNKGLSILYGERGTGKTSIINYIASNLDRVVIFIPNNLIEHTINNPDFRKFLKNYQQPILILDDCETLFHEHYSKVNPTSNNLLQLIDGMLSESIEATFITIFNTDSEDDIDESLLDCNSLIDILNFKNLSIEEANELSDNIGLKKKYKTDTRLIDVISKRNDSKIRKIGL